MGCKTFYILDSAQSGHRLDHLTEMGNPWEVSKMYCTDVELAEDDRFPAIMEENIPTGESEHWHPQGKDVQPTGFMGEVHESTLALQTAKLMVFA